MFESAANSWGHPNSDTPGICNHPDQLLSRGKVKIGEYNLTLTDHRILDWQRFFDFHHHIALLINLATRSVETLEPIWKVVIEAKNCENEV